MQSVSAKGIEPACDEFGAPSNQAILLLAGLGTQMLRSGAPLTSNTI